VTCVYYFIDMNIKKWVDKRIPLVQDRMQRQTLLNIFTRKSRCEISWLSDPEEGLDCPHGQLIEYHLADMKDKFIPLRNFYAMITRGGVEVCVHAFLTFALVDGKVTSHPAKDPRVPFE